ncbi:hypothetical protein WA577_004940, partial [Blastocystis sp. JDR]
MVRRVTFDDDGNAVPSSDEAVVSSEESEEEQPVEEREDEESSDEVVEETSSKKQKAQPMGEDDSSDSDEAPEEVTVSSQKAHTIQLYEKQKEAALTTKRRKRKERRVQEEELDESTLALLASNPNALTANPVEEDTGIQSKHIDLVHTTIQPTEKVEKKVDGFKLVALPKDPYAGVGKPINSSVLDFQRRHFYGKNSGRVEAASFLSQKRVKYTRK